MCYPGETLREALRSLGRSRPPPAQLEPRELESVTLGTDETSTDSSSKLAESISPVESCAAEPRWWARASACDLELVPPFLRLGWNIFECALLVLAALSFIGGGNYGTMPKWRRSLRLVLLLRLFSALPAFRLALRAPLKSSGILANLIALMLSLMGIWGAMGLYMYQDSMHNNCFYAPTCNSTNALPFGTGNGTTPIVNNASFPGGALCSNSTWGWSGRE